MKNLLLIGGLAVVAWMLLKKKTQPPSIAPVPAPVTPLVPRSAAVPQMVDPEMPPDLGRYIYRPRWP